MMVWLAGSRSATAERMATVLPVPTSPVIIADGLGGDGPGDPGGGLAAVGVPVQPGRRQVPAERHAGEPEPGDDGVDHQPSPSRCRAAVDGGELLLGVAEVAGQGGRAARASEMNSQAPLTAAAGSVPSSQPSRPAARAAASHRPTWARSCGRPAAASDSSPMQLVGVGGLGQAVAAEGGVVQGADRPGRGAGQGQGLLRGVSHGRLLPLAPSPAARGR